MPGNEVGDRVQNLLDQDSLSQEQCHTQYVEGNSSVYHSNVWGANERQASGPLISSSKNLSAQQSENIRGQSSDFSRASLNLTQSTVRPESAKNAFQNQHFNLNGFMHTPMGVHVRQNEFSFLGGARESDWNNMTPRGLPILESKQRGASQYSNSASPGGSESPVNFSFLGGQQQKNGQQPGMLRTLPRQQCAVNDAQPLQQQQVTFKHMQELQRRQQLQQFEAIQRSAMNHMSALPNHQTAVQHTSIVNGSSMHDISNYHLQSQVAGSTNWQQRDTQGYSNGIMVTPDQVQSMRFMGSVLQQDSESLYGVPVSNLGGGNAFTLNGMDRSEGLHAPAPCNSFSGNLYAPHTEQNTMQDGSTVSRSGSEGRSSFEHASSQGLGATGSLRDFSQGKPRNVLMSDIGGRGFVGGSDVLFEQTVVQGTRSEANSSQAAVGLDPSEEKFLFGNDVNIWEAFGSASASVNDGADPFNGVPSMQSGTWSALMQSAVAETSSSDTGIQDEWSGLGSQSSRPQFNNQHPSNTHNNEKPPVWVDSSRRAPVSSPTSNNVSTNNATPNTNSSHISAIEQQFTNQRSLTMKGGVPQQKRWLDNQQAKPPSENHVSENPNSSRGLSINDTSSLSQRHSTILLKSAPNSNVKMSAPLANSTADTVGHDPSNLNAGHESRPRLPGNHTLDLWKSVNNSANYGLEGLGNDHRNINMGQSIFDSSIKIPDGGAAEMRGTGSGWERENSSGDHQNIFSNHAMAGTVKENAWSITGDEHSLPGTQEMADQVGRKLPVSRKFQYHPMGDVDVNETSHVAQKNSRSQSLSHNLSSGLKGKEVYQRLLNRASASSSDLDKGLLSGFHGATTLGVPSSGVHAGYLPNAVVPFTRYGENSSPNQDMSPSQNMLELLHKVDQSKDQNVISNPSLSEFNVFPGTPAVGCVGPTQSQLSTSHGFNLQLAPPSQGIASPNFNDPAQSSLRMADSPSSELAPSETGDKTHTWLASGSSPHCLPSLNRPPQVESVSDLPGSSGNANADGSQANSKGNLTTPMRNPFQNQHLLASGRQMMGNQSSNVVSDRHPYHDQQMTTYQNQVLINQSLSNLHSVLETERDANQSGGRPIMRQIDPSMHAVMAGTRNNVLSPSGPYLWTSQQQFLAAQGCSASDSHRSLFQSNYAADSSFCQKNKDKPDGQRNTDALIAQTMLAAEESVEGESRCSRKAVGASQEECLARQRMDVSPSSSTASPKETDALHQSLRYDSIAQYSYSLLHQMQTMKNAALDSKNHESKRLKGVNNNPEAQYSAGKAAEAITGGLNSVVRDPSVDQTSALTGDAKTLSFSSETGTQFLQGPVSSQDMGSFVHGGLQNISDGPIASSALHMGISPQKTPVWFEKYGSIQNGQLLPLGNVPRVQMVNNADQHLIDGNLYSDACAGNPLLFAKSVTESRQISPSSYPLSEHGTSLHALMPIVSAPSPEPRKSKKRKTATSDLISWNKEIEQGFKTLQSISLAEVEWAQSSSRLVERAEDIINTNEDLLPMDRPRHRLILSTKLMQQVLCPLSASVLSLDAKCTYEVILYSMARFALRDACSLICGMTSDSSPVSETLLTVKAKVSDIRGQHFTKVVEDLTNRAKELESDLLRLDKHSSILDFRLDCQDLERFSVINRFARFHGRSQADGVEAASSSDATSVPHKPCPQRYVSAHSMPRVVPDRVQCLSL